MNKYFIYYKVEPTFMPDKELLTTHVLDPKKFRLVRVFKADNKEDVFRQMQGEHWSPNGEARFGIESLGLQHTSMSVGDVILEETTNNMYQCMMSDWEQVPTYFNREE